MNEQIGFACGGSQFFKSILLKTSDGGNTWQNIVLDNSVPQKQLYALAISSTGVLHTAGFDGVTYYSNDTGTTMIFQQAPTYTNWKACDFRTPDELYLCGEKGLGEGTIRRIEKTDNWAYPFIQPQQSIGLQHIVFTDSNVAYASGFGGILKSANGGQNWEFTSAKNDHFTASIWFSINEGIAIGWEGTILRTTNGGEDWKKIRNGNNFLISKKRLKNICKNKQDELIICGENGCLLYSNDKGISWTELESFTDISFEQVTFLNDKTFFAVGDAGRIFKVELP